jgi:hypothetical protein
MSNHVIFCVLCGALLSPGEFETGTNGSAVAVIANVIAESKKKKSFIVDGRICDIESQRNR